jgi:hypothetical protein
MRCVPATAITGFLGTGKNVIGRKRLDRAAITAALGN